MKLYRIQSATNPAIVGTYPQAELDSSLKPYRADSPDSYLKIPGEGPMPFELNVPYLKTRQGARLTDVLSCAFLGPFSVVSSRLLDLIKSFRVQGLEAFPTVVRHGDRYDRNYHLVRFYSSLHKEYVDFSETTGAVLEKHPEQFNCHIIKMEFSGDDRESLETQIRKFYHAYRDISIQPRKLVFRNIDFDDLFLCNYGLGGGLFFTGKAKESFERAAITGIRFEEYYNTELGARIFEFNT